MKTERTQTRVRTLVVWSSLEIQKASTMEIPKLNPKHKGLVPDPIWSNKELRHCLSISEIPHWTRETALRLINCTQYGFKVPHNPIGTYTCMPLQYHRVGSDGNEPKRL